MLGVLLRKRIGYESGIFWDNPRSKILFSRRTQRDANVLASSKWLMKNNEDENLCPARLFLKLMEKRT